MTKEHTTAGLNITREQMIQLLNEDLAGEYQAIIAYTVYSQVSKGPEYTDIARELEAHAGEELAHAIKIAKQIDCLGGMPGVTPKPVKTSNDPITMLRADLENERTTVSFPFVRLFQLSRSPGGNFNHNGRVTPHRHSPAHRVTCRATINIKTQQQKGIPMAKKSRGGRMTAAKKRAAKGPGGKGMVKNRPAGRKIMST